MMHSSETHFERWWSYLETFFECGSYCRLEWLGSFHWTRFQAGGCKCDIFMCVDGCLGCEMPISPFHSRTLLYFVDLRRWFRVQRVVILIIAEGPIFKDLLGVDAKREADRDPT